MENILYFDCLSGIAGDMTIAALLHLGIDQEVFLKELGKINIEGYKIDIKSDQKNGIYGLKFDVIIEGESSGHSHGEGHKHSHDKGHGDHHSNGDELNSHSHEHHHRNFNDIKEIITSSELSDKVKRLSIEIFEEVAKAEAKIHNKSLEEVHFHEVGAVDSIVDIIGAAIAVDMLNLDKIYASPLHVGTGYVKCAHGKIPVPAPATMEILKGVPIYSRGIRSELVTPTGAAIVKVLAEDFISLPAMVIDEIGYGVGTKDLEIANVLRVYKGKKKLSNLKEKAQSLRVLECNIDDMSGEIYSYILPLLFEAGAKDVYYTDIQMKKNRPGVMLSVLADKFTESEIEAIIFKETTTFGIRKYDVDRVALKRDFKKVETEFGEITVKIAYDGDAILKYAPEYEECAKAAKHHSVPFAQVFDAAKRAFKA